MVDPQHFRACLGQFVTGVTVVTCMTEDGYHGATVNAFTSVSMDPPLIQVSLNRRSKASAWVSSRPFVVNVLAEPQHDLAMHFAGQGRADAVPWRTDWEAPALGGCLANVYCRPWRSYDGGDHLLVLGEVEHFESREGDPLVFYRGSFRDVGVPLNS